MTPTATPPTIRSAPSVPRTLFGRDDALSLLDRALVPGSITALVGPPGVGKSTLVAALVANRGETLWVDLANASTPADLWAALAGDLGAKLSGAENALAEVTAALAQHAPATVVFDAAEHLREPAWEELGRLARALPGVAWAVTSIVRPAAHVRVLEVGPLAEPDAVALLVARARERALDARVDPAAPVWAALADRLGRLPLALELAAGRFGVLTPAQILERLDRPSLLAGGRHGTLDGALRYAWGLLGAEDRAALAACAVFRGGFDLAAAEAVLGDDALDRLTALRERSALSLRDERFYVFDGLRRLAEVEEADVLRAAEARHREWYAGLGRTLRRAMNGQNAYVAVATLRIERPNFEAAWARAVGVDPVAAAGIAVAIVMSARVHGPPSAADSLGDPVTIAHAVGGSVGAELLVEWATLALDRERLDAAQGAAEAAVDLAERAGDAEMLSYAYAELGLIHHHRGDWDRARAHAVRSAELAPDAFRRGIALAGIAVNDCNAGRLRESAAGFEAALDALRGADSIHAVATVRVNLAVTRAMQGRFDEAQVIFEECLPVLGRVYLPSALEGELERVLVHLLQGRADEAAASLAAAERIRVEIGRPEQDGFFHYGDGLVRWSNGDRAGARACFAEAATRLPAGAPRQPGTVLAFAAAVTAGPTRPCSSLRTELAVARQAGALPDLLAILEAWAAGEPLPPQPEWETADARLARKLVGGAAPWRMDADGRWFERPTGRVDLSRRGPMRRILSALLHARHERPGTGLSVDDLFAAGWPGETAMPEAASARVYTAIRELRALGLEPVLVRHAEGYLLDPEFSLSID